MKARKKPVVVDVVELPELNEEITDNYYEEIYKELENSIPYLANNHLVVLWSSDEFDNRRISLGNPIKYWYVIRTLEGDMKADPGDYLVYGGHDDIWAIKKDIFDQTYEVLE